MKQHIDTKADKEIRQCLEARQSFSVIAGAGSGKTTSLTLALEHLRKLEGRRLRRDGQRVACITYTNRAAEVISSRLDWDDLFLVSTLHSFLWGEVKRFTPNIREALRQHIIPAHIKRKSEDDNGGQSKKATAARERIASLKADLEILNSVKQFSYEETSFSDYPNGQLGHDDIIEVAAWLISHNELLRKMIGQRYPYIFVDEAQDTFESVVAALNKLCEGEGLPIVGYFGDPMQQIYDKRAGSFRGPNTSVTITKEENFRCSRKVIDLLNAFRTDVQQVPAAKNINVEGSVLITLVAAEKPLGNRGRYSEEQIERALTRFDEALEAWGWVDSASAKRLFLVRQMIARRLGFSQLQALFTGPFASSRAQEEYEKGEHFLLKPFVESLSDLVVAHRRCDLRRVLDILRRSSPAFDPRGPNSKRTLGEMKELAIRLTEELSQLWDEGTLKEILALCRQRHLCRMSERLAEHLDRDPREEEYDDDMHSRDKGDWLADKFLKMPTNEILRFVSFVSENTPLSTQHGVKGEEYKDVLVIFDDVEAGWHNYSFTRTLTPDTSGAATEGQYDRSTKLAYVCFSRSEENLRILLFTPNPEVAKKELVSKRLFEEAQISIVG